MKLSDVVIKAIGNAEKYQHITRVGVFGSHARNEADATSDLDILIDYESGSDEVLDIAMDEMGGFMEDVEELIPGKIDYVTWYGLMRSKNHEFREEVLRDVIWVYES